MFRLESMDHSKEEASFGVHKNGLTTLAYVMMFKKRASEKARKLIRQEVQCNVSKAMIHVTKIKSDSEPIFSIKCFNNRSEIESIFAL